MPLPRLIAALIGLAMPLALAGAADAKPHHGPAHVQTATYKVVQHHARHRTHRRHASLVNRQLAQVRHHNIMRGS